MKKRKDQKAAIAVSGAWWLWNLFIPARAIGYGRAAQRDERNGFPYTAAVEWRNAAELFAPHTLAAAYCWRQWERIMRLPRRLAEPAWVPSHQKFYAARGKELGATLSSTSILRTATAIHA